MNRRLRHSRYPENRRAHRPDEETIEKLRREQTERLKRINQKSEAELKSRVEEKEPEGKHVKFNSTLEDVCTIEETNQEQMGFTVTADYLGQNFFRVNYARNNLYSENRLNLSAETENSKF